MKKIFLIFPFIILTGCTTQAVPVKPKFPEAISHLMIACPELKAVPDNTTKLSETISIVSYNYSLYHECKVKVEMWAEWYTEQKKIYDEVK